MRKTRCFGSINSIYLILIQRKADKERSDNMNIAQPRWKEPQYTRRDINEAGEIMRSRLSPASILYEPTAYAGNA